LNSRKELNERAKQQSNIYSPVITNTAENDDVIYYAILYLIYFLWFGKESGITVTIEQLLPPLKELACLIPKNRYQARQDAMTALVRLQIENRFGPTDPRATNILTDIVSKISLPLDVRRDALNTLVDPYAIEHLDESQAVLVLEVLFSALISQPRGDMQAAFETELDKEKLVAAIEKIKSKSWQQKVEILIRLLEQGSLTRGDLDAGSLIYAVTPPGIGPAQIASKQASFLIEAADLRKHDPRMTDLLADLLIAAMGGNPTRAGHEINAYETAHKMPRGSMEELREAVGGEPALSEITAKLQGDLETYFQKPISELNSKTIKMWETIISGAQLGFFVRLVMSSVVFLVVVTLVAVSAYKIFDSNNLNQGTLFSFVSGLICMFLIIYSGPLKDIRQSIADLGTANAAFIGYVHQVLEASHTFSFFYTKEQKRLDRELHESSTLIHEAMKDAIEALNRKSGQTSEGNLFKLLRMAIPLSRSKIQHKDNCIHKK